MRLKLLFILNLFCLTLWANTPEMTTEQVKDSTNLTSLSGFFDTYLSKKEQKNIRAGTFSVYFIDQLDYTAASNESSIYRPSQIFFASFTYGLQDNLEANVLLNYQRAQIMDEETGTLDSYATFPPYIINLKYRPYSEKNVNLTIAPYLSYDWANEFNFLLYGAIMNYSYTWEEQTHLSAHIGYFNLLSSFGQSHHPHYKENNIDLFFIGGSLEYESHPNLSWGMDLTFPLFSSIEKSSLGSSNLMPNTTFISQNGNYFVNTQLFLKYLASGARFYLSPRFDMILTNRESESSMNFEIGYVF
jgi:hypothetical protein